MTTRTARLKVMVVDDQASLCAPVRSSLPQPGVNNHLGKPFTVQTLKAKIEAVSGLLA